jgi:Protein of unknown function (DUF2000)
MLYQDNDHKIIAVINPNIASPQLMNALGHATAGLLSKFRNLDDMQLLKYSFQSDESDPSYISRYPYIILKAKNNNQLKALHQTVNDTGIVHNTFTDSMLGSSADDQMLKTKNTNVDDLTYFLIVMFGEADVLTPLTKKFSLFNG